MKKLLLFLALASCSPFANAFSNLIVFGDSQSDIGNLPESANAGVEGPFYYQGLPYNLYVPLSNPVYGDQDNATDQLFHNLFNAADLPQQPLINQSIRAGRSVNWSQYLFVTLKAKGALLSESYIPWVRLYGNPGHYPQNISVDYAFAGALSYHHCADEGYTEMEDTFCTPAAIFNTQNIYRMHPNDDDLRRAVAVPGVQKQIELFADDVKAGRLEATPDTLYVLWSGANDLTNSFLHLLTGGTLKDFYQQMSQNVPDMLAGNDSAITKLYDLGARNIVIMTQQNLGLTPEASTLTKMDATFIGRYLNAYVLNFLVLRYNLALINKVMILQKRYPDLHLHIINLQELFNRLSLRPGTPFYKNLGLACQNKDADTYKAILHGDLVICTDYLYWNRAHMTYQGNRAIAESVIKELLP